MYTGKSEYYQRLDNGSCMSREAHVQFCERLRGRLPRPTLFVVFAKSKRAAGRLLESSRKYLENHLKLTLNLEKSKAISLYSRKFKFLGFALGKNGKGTYIRVHKNSLAKARAKLKELTRRNQGKNVREVMEKVKVYIRG